MTNFPKAGRKPEIVGKTSSTRKLRGAELAREVAGCTSVKANEIETHPVDVAVAADQYKQTKYRSNASISATANGGKQMLAGNRFITLEWHYSRCSISIGLERRQEFSDEELIFPTKGQK